MAAALPLAAAPAGEAQSGRVVPFDDPRRKPRVQAALRNGDRVASDDRREGEYFTQLHRGILGTLAQARQLGANEHQYIMALIAHSYDQMPWAVLDRYDAKTPKLADWSAWLGGMPTQQVYRIRESLHAWGVISYEGEDEETHEGGDSSRVIFNPVWESWDPAIFTAHKAKSGGGRPSRKLASLDEAPLNMGDEKSSSAKFSDPSLASLDEAQGAPKSSTRKFNGASRQARPQATLQPVTDTLFNTETIETSDTKEMPATQGATAVASAPSRDHDAPPEGWPERIDGEDDLAFYKRAMRLVKRPVPGLAYIAHLHLGVPSLKPTIGRLGGTLNKLVKETDAGRRYGLVVQAILKAAATELDSDPLNYVERVALSLANGAHQQRYGGGRFEPTPNGEVGRGKVRMSAAMRARRSTGAKPYWGVSEAQEGGAQ